MDDKQVAELRKFINMITEKKIHPFIDIKRLCASGIYTLVRLLSTSRAALMSLCLVSQSRKRELISFFIEKNKAPKRCFFIILSRIVPS
jgi:hypothetical protein